MQPLVRRSLLVLAALAVFVVPIAVSAAGGFTDVADDNIFKNDIQWMADNEITKGCNPPTNDKFCPSDVVTRETMSAFMHRLGVNKVVDAKTAITADKLQGKAPAELASLAGSATAVAVSFPGSGSNNFRVASLTGFDVPAAGGVLTATAAGQAATGSDVQLGVLWIEIDGTGACDAATVPTGAAIYETVTTGLHNLVASNAAAVAAGAHRIDLCTAGLGVASTNMTARLNVVWSETASGAGVASAGGQSWQQMLNPYAGILDN